MFVNRLVAGAVSLFSRLRSTRMDALGLRLHEYREALSGAPPEVSAYVANALNVRIRRLRELGLDSKAAALETVLAEVPARATGDVFLERPLNDTVLAEVPPSVLVNEVLMDASLQQLTGPQFQGLVESVRTALERGEYRPSTVEGRQRSTVGGYCQAHRIFVYDPLNLSGLELERRALHAVAIEVAFAAMPSAEGLAASLSGRHYVLLPDPSNGAASARDEEHLRRVHLEPHRMRLLNGRISSVQRGEPVPRGARRIDFPLAPEVQATVVLTEAFAHTLDSLMDGKPGGGSLFERAWAELGRSAERANAQAPRAALVGGFFSQLEVLLALRTATREADGPSLVRLTNSYPTLARMTRMDLGTFVRVVLGSTDDGLLFTPDATLAVDGLSVGERRVVASEQLDALVRDSPGLTGCPAMFARGAEPKENAVRSVLNDWVRLVEAAEAGAR